MYLVSEELKISQNVCVHLTLRTNVHTLKDDCFSVMVSFICQAISRNGVFLENNVPIYIEREDNSYQRWKNLFICLRNDYCIISFLFVGSGER